MKKLLIASFFVITFIFGSEMLPETILSNDPGITVTLSKETISPSECAYNSITDEGNKSKCPYIQNIKKNCPFLEDKITNEDSGLCPFSGKKKSVKPEIKQENRSLKIKIS